jgi:hypothetical protein
LTHVLYGWQGSTFRIFKMNGETCYNAHHS